MKRQEVNLNDIDLGTSANGYYLYAMPTLFYNLGDKAILNGKGHSFKLGIGAGIGYLKVKGDIIFTNSLSQERHIFDIESLSWAYGVMFDYRFNRWIFLYCKVWKLFYQWANSAIFLFFYII